MEKVKLVIAGLSYSQTQSGAYALMLVEVGGKRRMPIVIGGFEAQAIAVELEKMKPTRPLTHDLFKSFALAYDVFLKEVITTKVLISLITIIIGIYFVKKGDQKKLI